MYCVAMWTCTVNTSMGDQYGEEKLTPDGERSTPCKIFGSLVYGVDLLQPITSMVESEHLEI